MARQAHVSGWGRRVARGKDAQVSGVCNGVQLDAAQQQQTQQTVCSMQITVPITGDLFRAQQYHSRLPTCDPPPRRMSALLHITCTQKISLLDRFSSLALRAGVFLQPEGPCWGLAMPWR